MGDPIDFDRQRCGHFKKLPTVVRANGEISSFDAEQGINWEFDTIRGHPDNQSETSGLSSTSPSTPPVTSSSYQAPRSLRMLFEDSSVPPPLSDNFLRNNLGSSRQHHGQPSLGVAASAPSGGSFLASANSISLPDTHESTSLSVKGPDDVTLNTARQPNFSFPRLTAPKTEFDDNTARAPSRPGTHTPKGSGGGPKRSPSPLSQVNSPPTPPAGRGGSNYKDLRNAKGVADLALPNASASTESLPSGRTTPANERAETPSRPSTAMSSTEELSPKSTQPRTRNVASPMNFQFPPLARSGRSGTSNASRNQEFVTPTRQFTTSQSRPHTPVGTSVEKSTLLSRDPGISQFGGKVAGQSQGVGLTPPKMQGHPISRSMDSARAGSHGGGSAAGLTPPVMGGRGGHGSQSDSEALGLGEGTRLAPSRLFAVRRQASMEMGLGERNNALRDHLPVSLSIHLYFPLVATKEFRS